MSAHNHTSRDLGGGLKLIHYPAQGEHPERYTLVRDQGPAWVTVWLTRDQILAMTAVVANAVPLA